MYTPLKLLTFVVFCFSILFANGQDPERFKDQIDKLAAVEYNFDADEKVVVFTGSSSVRMWKDVQERFPGYNIINNGFGGSHFSDLLYYYNELIIKAEPEILFIYEGDNDIAGNKKPAKILKQAKLLTKQIQKDLPDTKVIFISPKPSLVRWNLRGDYKKLNKKLERFCHRKENLQFADVWSIMLNQDGTPIEDIFISDGLHMNNKGYDLWEKVIGEFL